jgi:hypothetical protein
LGVVIAVFAKHEKDKRWEEMREVLERDGIMKVIIFFYAVYLRKLLERNLYFKLDLIRRKMVYLSN